MEPEEGPGKVVHAKKQPPAELFTHIFTRGLVTVAFWAVALLLGLPLWWKTTSVYRANLPLQEMLDWADGKVWKLRQTPMHTDTNCRPVAPFSLFTSHWKLLQCRLKTLQIFSKSLRPLWMI